AGYEGPQWARGKKKDENGNVVWLGFKSAGEQLIEAPLSGASSETATRSSETVNLPGDLPSGPAATAATHKCNLNDKRLEQTFKADERWKAIFATDNSTPPRQPTARQGKYLLQKIGKNALLLASLQ